MSARLYVVSVMIAILAAGCLARDDRGAKYRAWAHLGEGPLCAFVYWVGTDHRAPLVRFSPADDRDIVRYERPISNASVPDAVASINNGTALFQIGANESISSIEPGGCRSTIAGGDPP